MQIAVTHRLVDVNESRFIRSCSFVSVCFPQFAFLNFFPPLFNSLIFNCSPSTSLSASCDTQLSWNFGQVVFGIEGGSGQLIFLQFYLPAFVVGNETHHQSAGVGPGLVAEVGDVLYLQPRFFKNFPFYTFFQCLAGFEEACHQSVEGSSEVPGMHQQDFVSFAYQYNDGGGNGGYISLPQLGHFFMMGVWCSMRCHTRGRSGCARPIEYLEGLSCRTVLVRRDVVVRCAQAYHDPFIGFGHGLFQSKCTYLLAVGWEHFVYITSGFRCQRRLYTDGYAVFYFFLCLYILFSAAVGL